MQSAERGRNIFSVFPAQCPAALNQRQLVANNAAFSADYEKVVRIKPRFVIGAQGEAIISELGKVQPSFLSFLRKYIDAGR